MVQIPTFLGQLPNLVAIQSSLSHDVLPDRHNDILDRHGALVNLGRVV